MSLQQTLADALLNLPIIEAPNFNNSFFANTTLAAPTTTTNSAQRNGNGSSAHKKKDDSSSSSSSESAKNPASSDDSDEKEEDSDGREEEEEENPEDTKMEEDAPLRTPKRRLNYTLEFKNKVILYAEKTNNCQAAIKYQVPRQCIQRWRQIKPELEELMSTTPHSTKKKRLGGGGRPLKNVELDEKLDIWLKERIRERGTKITGKMIKDHAISIAGNDTFKASNGWLQRFMIRHGLAAPPAPKNAPATPPDSPPSSPEPEPTAAEAEWAAILAQVSQETTPRTSTRNRRKPAKNAPVSSSAPRRTSARRQNRGGVANAAELDGVNLRPEEQQLVDFLMSLQQGAGLVAGQLGAEPAAQEVEPNTEEVKREEPEAEEAESTNGAEPKKEEAEPTEAAKKKEAEPTNGAELEKEEAEPTQSAKKKKEEKKVELVKKGAEPGDSDSSSSSSDSDSSSDSSDEEE